MEYKHLGGHGLFFILFMKVSPVPYTEYKFLKSKWLSLKEKEKKEIHLKTFSIF